MSRGPHLYWLTQTLADLPPTDDWLSNGERQTLSALRFRKRRDDWRLGRWTAKLAVRAFLSGANPALRLDEIEIEAAADGAPHPIVFGTPADFSVSLSHSGDRGLAVVASAGVAAGCDIELVDPHILEFIIDYLTPQETAALAAAGPDERPLVAALYWSAKESALKALREGLRRDTRSVTVRLEPAPAGRAWERCSVRCEQTGRMFDGWWQRDSRYVWTIAAEAPAAEPILLRV